MAIYYGTLPNWSKWMPFAPCIVRYGTTACGAGPEAECHQPGPIETVGMIGRHEYSPAWLNALLTCGVCGSSVDYDDAKGCSVCPIVLCSDACRSQHQHLPQEHGQD